MGSTPSNQAESDNRKLVAINVHLHLELRRRLKMYAAGRGITMNDAANEIMERELPPLPAACLAG